MLDRIYQITKPYLDSERSLVFLATGSREKRGDINTGCSQVKRMVGLLEEAGNNSVLGLIDWDGKNQSSDRIKVLAGGKRDGLENCILDPLVLTCLVARDVRDRREQIGLPVEGGTFEIKQLAPNALQAIVDRVQAFVLSGDLTTDTDYVSCAYAGGLSLDIRADYLSLDDHQLEAKVFSAFPALQRYQGRAGALLVHIAESLLPDFPEFVPADFLTTFIDLLNAEL